jgi:hypothetical protein
MYTPSMAERRNACTILVGNPKGPRCRWKDNIQTGLEEVEFDDVDWSHLTQDTVSRGSYISFQGGEFDDYSLLGFDSM